ALRVARLWRADVVPVVLPINVAPLLDGFGIEAVDVRQSLFRLIEGLGHETVECELAWPSAVNLEPPVSDWLEQPAGRAGPTLEIVGVSRSGNRAYHPTPVQAAGAFGIGPIRPLPGESRTPCPLVASPRLSH